MKVSSVDHVFTLLPICHTHLSLQCSFSPTVAFFFSPTRGESKVPAPACMIQNTDLNSPLFFSLPPLLHCSCVTATPPLHFLSLSLYVAPPAATSPQYEPNADTVLLPFSCYFVCNPNIPSCLPVYQDATL